MVIQSANLMEIFIQECHRIFKSRSSIILAIVLLVFVFTTFLKTATYSQINFTDTLRKTNWTLNEMLTLATIEQKTAEKSGTERDITAKRIAQEIAQQKVEIWEKFEKDWQHYQNGTISEKLINTIYIKTLIQIELLDSFLCGVVKKGDVDLCTQYTQILTWLNIQIPDYKTFSEYMENISDSEIRHLQYLNRKIEIEKLLQDLERGFPLATASPRGPGLYVRNYFAQINSSGFLLPVIMIAYFLMNTLALYRSRAIFYSRSFSISPLKFWWIQNLATFSVGIGLFLLTFFIGFLACGICFGWTDLYALVPVDPSLWKTGFAAQTTFASNFMTDPFFNSTVAEGSYYPGSLTWIPCGQWINIVIILELWLIFLQCVTVFSFSFLFSKSWCLLICSLWMIVLCLLRFHFSIFNILPPFWPSVVDLLYGGFGIGWAVWIVNSILYMVILLTFDLFYIGRKDIR